MSLIGDLTGLGAAAGAISSITTAIAGVIDKVIPDPDLAAKLKNQTELAVVGQISDLNKAITDQAKAQAEVNLKEAESPSLFVSGWRPYVGWVCGGGLTYAFLMQPLLSWVASWFGGAPLPVLDSSVLMTVLTGMLGLGTLRTYEKSQGVERQSFGPAAVARKMFR